MRCNPIRLALCAAACALGTGMLAGCGGLPWQEISRNVENSKSLRVGMTKAEVLDVMGEPVSDETYCTPDVWFYYHKTVWADGLVTEDECMPLVFEDGKLAGWGNAFYAAYRINRKDHGQEFGLEETEAEPEQEPAQP